MKVLFAAGGTGGHLYPAIAIADALRERGDECAFVGTRDRLETRLVPAAGYRLLTISARPLARRFSLDILQTIGVNLLGVMQSLRILARERANVIVATGGYVCVPLVLAARIDRTLRRRRVSIALLEPNAVPGIANRLLALRSDEIWGAVDRCDPRWQSRYVRTGVPIRGALQRLPPRSEAVRRLGLDPSRETLFAFGASQGARSINDAVIGIVHDSLPPRWQILHLTGERDYERVHAAIGDRATVKPYLDNPADAYAAADLVLSRAGASTLAELIALNLPAILVPYPYATQGHQQANADAVVSAGAAVAIEDSALDSKQLAAALEKLTPERLTAMRQSARLLAGGDPVKTILARIDALAARKK